jgi:hypothetical protein
VRRRAKRRLFKNTQNIIFTHKNVLNTIHLDFRARVFAEEHPVADFNFQGDTLAVIAEFAGAGSHYLAFLRFFFGGIGDDDPTSGLFSSSTRSTKIRSFMGLICIWFTSCALNISQSFMPLRRIESIKT